jgi:hypothetical protein
MDSIQRLIRCRLQEYHDTRVNCWRSPIGFRHFTFNRALVDLLWIRAFTCTFTTDFIIDMTIVYFVSSHFGIINCGSSKRLFFFFYNTSSNCVWLNTKSCTEDPRLLMIQLSKQDGLVKKWRNLLDLECLLHPQIEIHVRLRDLCSTHFILEEWKEKTIEVCMIISNYSNICIFVLLCIKSKKIKSIVVCIHRKSYFSLFLNIKI